VIGFGIKKKTHGRTPAGMQSQTTTKLEAFIFTQEGDK